MTRRGWVVFGLCGAMGVLMGVHGWRAFVLGFVLMMCYQYGKGERRVEGL